MLITLSNCAHLTLGNGRDVDDVSFYPDENEVILPMLSRFRVKSRIVKNEVNLVIINLLEIPMTETIISFSTSVAASGTLVFNIQYCC